MLPSGPLAIDVGLHDGVGIGNSVNVPVGVMRPILLLDAATSVNQRFPSGPSAMSPAPLPGEGRGNSLKTAAGVMRPIRLARGSVNHTLPSGPATMPAESPPAGTPYSFTMPAGVMRPMPSCFVYQMLPSGPPAMSTGPVLVVDVVITENMPPTVSRPIPLGDVFSCVYQRLPS